MTYRNEGVTFDRTMELELGRRAARALFIEEALTVDTVLTLRFELLKKQQERDLR